MPQTSSSPNQPEPVFFNPELFGAFFRYVTEVSGLPQGKLSRDAKTLKARLLDAGIICAADPVGSLEQPVISNVMNGKQRPTYHQIYIWSEVIKAHYESDRLRQACKAEHIELPIYSYSEELLFYRLAGYAHPQHIQQATLDALNIMNATSAPSLIDHKEERWRRSTNALAQLLVSGARQYPDTGPIQELSRQYLTSQP